MQNRGVFNGLPEAAGHLSREGKEIRRGILKRRFREPRRAAIAKEAASRRAQGPQPRGADEGDPRGRRLLLRSPGLVRAAGRMLKKPREAAASFPQTLILPAADALPPRLRTRRLKRQLHGS